MPRTAEESSADTAQLPRAVSIVSSSHRGYTPVQQKRQTDMNLQCDHCRVRKIRCNKESPCSNCRSGGITCRITSTESQEPRQRVLISNQYERKIDAIENRLEGIEKLLQTLVGKKASTPSTDLSIASRSPSNPDADSKHGISQNPAQFEGDSSLIAHSKHASRTLEGLLQANPTIRYDPEVSSALESLKSMMQKQTLQPSHRLTGIDGDNETSVVPYNSSMPPYQDVFELLGNAKVSDFLFFFVWCPCLQPKHLVERYEKVYHRPETCSLAELAIANGCLHYLFSEYMMTPGRPSKYNDYAAVCLENFETCLSRFHVLVTPTFDNILAFSIGAGHAIQIADFSLCLALNSTAARLAQSLGWHRANIINEGDPQIASVKKVLFWSIYYFDKCLSLRLGRCSTIQDFDITVTIPEPSQDPNMHSWSLMLSLCVEIAAITGLIYEKLYSPGASSHSAQARSHTVRLIVARIQAAFLQNTKVLELTQYRRDYMLFFIHSNEVILNCLLTLTYRAEPQTSAKPFGFTQNCLAAARATMQAHQVCVKTVETNMDSSWAEYTNWTILATPFTPFMVLFSHVVSTLDLDDLKMLEEFVNSMDQPAPADGSQEAMAKFHQLCNAFYCLAKQYVVAMLYKDKEGQAPRTHTLVTDVGMSNMDLDMTVPQGTYAPFPPSTLPGPTASGDLSSEWFLSNTFDSWLSGDQQPLDFLGGDWSTFGVL